MKCANKIKKNTFEISNFLNFNITFEYLYLKIKKKKNVFCYLVNNF